MMNDHRLFTEESHWYVARTHARKESVALNALGAQNYRAFCPMIQKTVRHARRLMDRAVPLFPSYIFLAFEKDERHWRPINSTPGVQYLLSDGNGRPKRLPTAFAAELLTHTTADGIFNPRPPLEAGQRVRVRFGAFAGLIGEIEELDERGRVSLLLNLMSREVRVDMAAERLERIAETG